MDRGDIEKDIPVEQVVEDAVKSSMPGENVMEGIHVLFLIRRSYHMLI